MNRHQLSGYGYQEGVIVWHMSWRQNNLKPET
jgi:hypothetical protein